MTGMTNVTKLASEPSGQEFLVFTLGDEEYGIDILKVQEIRGYDQVTRIANTPAFIKGVTNLRGVIVPIVDLRIKFSQVDVDYNDNTVVIVLNLGQRPRLQPRPQLHAAGRGGRSRRKHQRRRRHREQVT